METTDGSAIDLNRGQYFPDLAPAAARAVEAVRKSVERSASMPESINPPDYSWPEPGWPDNPPYSGGKTI